MIPVTLIVGGGTYEGFIDNEILSSIQKQSKHGSFHLKKSRIFGPMGNIYKKVEYHGVSISIYQDVRTLKNGKKSVRFRVPYTENGKQRFVPFTNKPEEAEDFARRVAQKIKSQNDVACGTTLVAQEHTKLALEVFEKLASVYPSPIEAANLFAAAMAAIMKRAPGESFLQIVESGISHMSKDIPETPATVQNIFLQYIDSLDRRFCNSQKNAAHRRFKAEAQRFAKDFGPIEIHSIPKKEIEEWYSRRRSPNGSPLAYQTLVQYLGSLRDFFEFARKNNFLTCEKGCTAADLFSIPENDLHSHHDNSPPPLIYTVEQTQAIFNVAWADKKNRHWIPVLAMRFFGGIHLQEICKLRWADFMTARHIISISKAAAGGKHVGRSVYFSPDNFSHIALFIEEAKERGESNSWIIPGFEGRLVDYDGAERGFNRAFNAWLETCHIEKGKNVARHSYASFAMLLTNNISYIERMMGSQSATVYRHYINSDERTAKDADAYFKIRKPDCNPSVLRPFDWLPSGVIRHFDDLLLDIDDKEKHKNTWKLSRK